MPESALRLFRGPLARPIQIDRGGSQTLVWTVLLS